ncbi:hypothetical protein FO519_002193 [Halicephalobus sp. NKZ332]|nr:hypothetical protein FO519_002193 [Halicephalobus sp. NKZ332]
MKVSFFSQEGSVYFNSLLQHKKIKAFTSENMKHNWEEISKLPILGLGHTLEDFHEFLNEQNCLFFPWGGSVRDLVLGRFVSDVDAQITCDPKNLKLLCEEKYGSENCHHHHRGSYKLIVGNFPSQRIGSEELFVEPLDLAHWNTTFEVKKAHLEYGVNTLAYYVDQNILIDISGKALEDICGFKIRIPANPLFWEEWVNENAINKLLSSKIRRFIIDRLESNFNPQKALFFICHKFYEGKLDEFGTCQIFKSVDKEKSDENLRNFTQLISEDFGNSPFSVELKNLFQGMKVEVKDD